MSLSHWGDSNPARQEILECPSDDNYKNHGDKKSSSEFNNQGKEDEAVKAPLTACTPTMPSPPPTIIKEIEEMFLALGYSQVVVLMLVEDQRIESLWTLASFSDEDINATCDVIHRHSR